MDDETFSFVKSQTGNAPPFAKNATRESLPQPLLTELGRAFGMDFSAVRLFRSSTRLPPGAHGPRLAATCNDVIWLDPRAPAAADANARGLLAHEFAHVAQRRIALDGAAIADVSELEAEADGASLQFLNGSKPWISRGAPPDILYWEAPGHYYTTYYAALLAGLENVVAQQYAFFCQMPDQVFELDAKSLVETWIVDSAQSGSEIQVDLFEEYSYLAQICCGLHTLTGAIGGDETKLRRSKFSNSGASDPLTIGLALHAFGDSYAHRKGSGAPSDRLYKYPWGHGPESIRRRIENKFCEVDQAQLTFEMRLLGASMSASRAVASSICNILPDVDNIAGRKTMYRDYLFDLYDIMLQLNGNLRQGSPRLKKEDLQPFVDAATASADSGMQIRSIRKSIDELLASRGAVNSNGRLQKMHTYAPEDQDDALPWSVFSKTQSSNGVMFGQLASAQKTAAKWFLLPSG